MIGKLIGCIALFLFALAGTQLTIVTINSSSMKPNMEEGDTLLMKRVFEEEKKSLHRGQVIMFTHKPKGGLIKRIIGMPGDIIIISNKTVYLKKINQPNVIEITNTAISHGVHKQNGYPLSVYSNEIEKKQYLVAITGIVPERYEDYYLQEHLPVGQFSVPEGKLFVMGDNRDFSVDSRFIGFINIDSVIAVPLTVGEQ